MPLPLTLLVGLLAATAINCAADRWPAPVRVAPHWPARRAGLVMLAVPAFFALLNQSLPGRATLPAMLFAGLLALVAVIDLERRIVPNVIVLPATAAAVVMATAQGSVMSLAGAAVAFLLFLALYAAGRLVYGAGAMGMGDVKLAMFIGAVLGLAQMPYALALGLFAAGGAALLLLGIRRVRPGDAIPLGYCLTLGGLAVLAWSGGSFA